MTNKIRTSEATLKPLRDTGVAFPRVEAGQVQAALGAEASAAPDAGQGSSPLIRELAVAAATESARRR
jgi:hypothetical protein